MKRSFWKETFTGDEKIMDLTASKSIDLFDEIVRVLVWAALNSEDQ